MVVFISAISVSAQLLVIVQIFVAQCQTIDSLSHQLLHRMFDQIGIPIISEAGSKLAEDPDTLFDLPQEQTTAVTGDRSAVELRSDFASLLGMKSKDKLVTGYPTSESLLGSERFREAYSPAKRSAVDLKRYYHPHRGVNSQRSSSRLALWRCAVHTLLHPVLRPHRRGSGSLLAWIVNVGFSAFPDSPSVANDCVWQQ